MKRWLSPTSYLKKSTIRIYYKKKIVLTGRKKCRSATFLVNRIHKFEHSAKYSTKTTSPSSTQNIDSRTNAYNYKSMHSYRSVYSSLAALSVAVLPSVFSISAIMLFGSIASVTSVLSVASASSACSIGSVASSFSIHSINSSFSKTEILTTPSCLWRIAKPPHYQ